MATANDNRTSFSRAEAAALNPFLGPGDQAETMRNIKLGLRFISNAAPTLDICFGNTGEGLQLYAECMISALQQEEALAVSSEEVAA